MAQTTIYHGQSKRYGLHGKHLVVAIYSDDLPRPKTLRDALYDMEMGLPIQLLNCGFEGWGPTDRTSMDQRTAALKAYHVQEYVSKALLPLDVIARVCEKLYGVPRLVDKGGKL